MPFKTPPSCDIPNIPPETADPLQKLAYLADRQPNELNSGEVGQILQHIPFLVVADDDIVTRRATVSAIIQGRKDITDLTRCARSIPVRTNGRIPVLHCESGSEAETAVKLTNAHGFNGAVFVFDHNMGTPEGLEIFKEHDQNFPAGSTRVLFSAKIPEDHPRCLQDGVLDAAITKGVSREEIRAKVAHAFLGRTFKPQK